jgi:hypothetical protein
LVSSDRSLRSLLDHLGLRYGENPRWLRSERLETTPPAQIGRATDAVPVVDD